jgi:hypothetical protein
LDEYGRPDHTDILEMAKQARRRERERAKREGRKPRSIQVTEFIALGVKSDPFYSAMESNRAEAEWFAQMRDEYGLEGHLRRMHYRLVSQEHGTILLPATRKVTYDEAGKKKYDEQATSEPYENTEECWNKLGLCSKHARHLDLVEADQFEDARTPDPTVIRTRHDDGEDPPEPEANLQDFPHYHFPSVTLRDCDPLEVPDTFVTGYEYDQADQPYHLELWIEKSTMEDVLVTAEDAPCPALGVNYVPGVGFASITSTIRMLERIDRLPDDKPSIVFCVVDFDPAGDHMPTAMARQIEFYLAKYASGKEVKVLVIGLTREQVIHYDLPRVPVKESDVRKKDWEDRRGEGAVELDALEALHPGELAKLVREAVKPYRDHTLEAELEKADTDADRELRERWEANTQAEREAVEELLTDAQEIVDGYKDRVQALDEELQGELEGVRARLTAIRNGVRAAWDDLDKSLPDRPEAVPEGGDEPDWLFDSNREYPDQINAYRRHKGKAPAGRGKKGEGEPVPDIWEEHGWEA